MDVAMLFANTTRGAFYSILWKTFSVSLGISSSKDLSIAMVLATAAAKSLQLCVAMVPTTKLSEDLLGSRERWMGLWKDSFH